MTSTADPSANLPARRASTEWLSAFGVSLATAMLLISPFFWLGNASGHDISFHASSWMDVAGQWREGIAYPRWAEWANYGFGEPRFVFYPPLSWMLGAALSFVAPWRAVPGAFIVFVQTIAGLCFFGAGRRFFPRGGALFGAACYAANPYAQLIIYMRSDFAELLAWALMPVLLLTAMKTAALADSQPRSQARAIALFALAFAGVWLSNAPAGVIASYSVALVFGWATLVKKSMWPLLRGATGLALGFGLACFYLVPAACEQRWVNISQALSSGLLPSQNFLYTQISDPEHNWFNWIASSVAILLIVMAGTAALAAERSFSKGVASQEKEKLTRLLLLLCAAATILMLRPSAIFWEHLPKLRFMQFPWRWMGILALSYAFFGAVAIGQRRAGWIWGIAVLLATAGTTTFLVQKAWWDSDDLPSLQDAIADGQGFEGTDEYDPIGDDRTNLPQKSPPVKILPAEASEQSEASANRKVEVHVERWNAEERELTVTSSETVRLALRLLDYPAWRVEVNGKPVRPEHVETTDQMILLISPGTQRITAKFVRTPDRTVGTAISILALLVLLGLFNAGGVRLLSASP